MVKKLDIGFEYLLFRVTVTVSLPCSSAESALLLATGQSNLRQGQNFAFPAATTVSESLSRAHDHLAPVAFYRE